MKSYRLSFTAASLMALDTQALAAFVAIRQLDWVDVEKEASEQNILGSQQRSTSERKVKELVGRLRCLSPQELRMLLDCGTREAALIAWIGCARFYPIVANFAQCFFRKSSLGLWPVVTPSMVFGFLHEEEAAYPQLAGISSSTREKVVQVLRLMARQAGLMENSGQVLRVSLSDRLVELARQDEWFRQYLPVEYNK